MLDMNRSLGRAVPTTADVIQVIRPQLRVMRVFYQGMFAALQAGAIASTDEHEPADAADESACAHVFDAIKADAIASVKQWASDVEVVFDGGKLDQFVGDALSAAMALPGHFDPLPDGALAY